MSIDDRLRAAIDRAPRDLTAPTLVIHGAADPMFPLEHGEALADEIPDAKLLTLERAGHGVDRADWETIVRAIVEHTASAIGPPDDDRPRADHRRDVDPKALAVVLVEFFAS
jgi:pimeloyl-ACP methyl ester carboxylesterase